MLGALFPPNGRYALLVALIPSQDLFDCAKDLFVGAKQAGVLCSHLAASRDLPPWLALGAPG